MVIAQMIRRIILLFTLNLCHLLTFTRELKVNGVEFIIPLLQIQFSNKIENL